MNIQISQRNSSEIRKEDDRLLRGVGKFSGDYQYEGQLYAVVIRSTVAHARIVHMDLDAVRDAQGVQIVWTHKDITARGAGDMPNIVSFKDVNGEEQRVNEQPVLARDKVFYVGQPVAVVIASTRQQASDAAELAFIEYEEFDAVVDVLKAGDAGAVQLHDNAPNNLSLHFSSGDEQKVSEAFDQASYVSKLVVNSQRLMGVPMEPRTVVARHDSETGISTLHAPNQGLQASKANLAKISGVPIEQLHVECHDVGGSFGIRSSLYPEHIICLLAARELNSPVRWVGSRSESFMSDVHGRGIVLEGNIAIDENGKILAIRFSNTVDIGAFNYAMSTHIGARNLSLTFGGVYQVPHLFMESHLYYTNMTPMSPYRGAGRPDIAYAIERLIDHTCREHGFDPVAFRRNNFIPTDAFPYTTANGTVYDLCRSEELMNRALELGQWEGFEARRAEARRRGKLRGLGFSTFLEASGPGGAPCDQVLGYFSHGRLQLRGVTGPSGQGHETTYALVVEQELGIPASIVDYQPGNPPVALTGNATGGSRSAYGLGSAIKDLAQRMMDDACPFAADLLGVSVQDVRAEGGVFFDMSGDGTSRVTLHDIVERFGRDQEDFLKQVGEASSFATFPNGCHIAELEIDPETGITEVIAYHAVDDIGRVISPVMVRGQVHGGVLQGWGQAFCEQVVYDDHGQLLTGSFMDYAMPRADAMVEPLNVTVEVVTELNKLGSKGIGESGCTGSLPAFANAMIDALSPFGVRALDMPFTPQKVWQTIQDHAGNNAN